MGDLTAKLYKSIHLTSQLFCKFTDKEEKGGKEEGVRG